MLFWIPAGRARTHASAYGCKQVAWQGGKGRARAVDSGAERGQCEAISQDKAQARATKLSGGARVRRRVVARERAVLRLLRVLRRRARIADAE